MSGYICPVCRAPRDTELRDHISWQAHLRIALIVGAAAAVAYYFSGIATAGRIAFFYLPLWAGSEFVHWAQMREASKCHNCDFDPVLYQKNPVEARRRVEAKLNTYVENIKGELKKRSPNAKNPSPATATTEAAATTPADAAVAASKPTTPLLR
ncbi:MAG: hypothetical protein JST16_08345 [Bdellovibrionales bacterium]|nr:hypothetical protein [Bdellovibrionales bacterium]